MESGQIVVKQVVAGLKGDVASGSKGAVVRGAALLRQPDVDGKGHGMVLFSMG